MIKAILVDDEIHCLDTLTILLTDYCPEVMVAEKCVSGKKAIEAIDRLKPDLVFLDIEMPFMNGFEFLEQYKEIPFSVIFTTSYDKYAIRAIRFSALDYLLKPIDSKELMAAVSKVVAHRQPPTTGQFRMLLEHIQNKEQGFSRIAVPTGEGFELIPGEEIVLCEADDNYTHIHLKNKTKIVACRTLKEMEEMFQDFSAFLRVHHSYLVNLNEVTKYIRGDGGYLVMKDGTTVNVSRSRKELLLRKFQPNKE